MALGAKQLPTSENCPKSQPAYFSSFVIRVRQAERSKNVQSFCDFMNHQTNVLSEEGR